MPYFACTDCDYYEFHREKPDECPKCGSTIYDPSFDPKKEDLAYHADNLRKERMEEND